MCTVTLFSPTRGFGYTFSFDCFRALVEVCECPVSKSVSVSLLISLHFRQMPIKLLTWPQFRKSECQRVFPDKTWRAAYMNHGHNNKCNQSLAFSHTHRYWDQTSLLFQPKLSVRSAVVALWWSTNSRRANSLWSSSGITLTWGQKRKCHKRHTYLIRSRLRSILQFLLWLLVSLCLPGILALLAPDWKAPLQIYTQH